jgi:HSP20 family protein
MTLFEPLPLFELSRELDRMLAQRGTMVRSFVPLADVVVTDDEVTITIDVPGLKAEDITIELDGDVLTVSGERTSDYATDERENGRVRRLLERGFGKFRRALRVPKGLDADAIEASMDDGVLTVRIPMPETRKPRRIEVAAGGSQPQLEQTSSEEASGEEREHAGATA